MITIVGLGPGSLDRVPGSTRSVLLDTGATVVARTIKHPAAVELAELRDVMFCDDLYDAAEFFDDVYGAIAERVLSLGETVNVVYAVPGSPTVGEFAVRKILDHDPSAEVVPSESFIDAVLSEIAYDPLDRGLQILNGYELPDPLVLDKPTIIAHLDRPEVLADVAAVIDRVTDDDATVAIMRDLGTPNAVVAETKPEAVDLSLAGLRTSLFADVSPGGLIGAVEVMRTLREECPWDREQTHRSLVKNLVEEVYELVEAISRLGDGDPDLVTYAEVEDELGDVMLQVLFHAVIARQAGVFDIDDVAEVMRQKLVRRHPHVFGDVEVSSASEVKANWDRIKESERPDGTGSSLDGIPSSMPALHRASKMQNRAAKVGFDWDQPAHVLEKVHEELDELAEAMDHQADIEGELGDVLFSVVNLARHLGIDCELSLRAAIDRFEDRFRRMEAEGSLEGLDLDGLNERWERAKRS